jgi:hypothetical protein
MTSTMHLITTLAIGLLASLAAASSELPPSPICTNIITQTAECCLPPASFTTTSYTDCNACALSTTTTGPNCDIVRSFLQHTRITYKLTNNPIRFAAPSPPAFQTQQQQSPLAPLRRHAPALSRRLRLSAARLLFRQGHKLRWLIARVARWKLLPLRIACWALGRFAWMGGRSLQGQVGWQRRRGVWWRMLLEGGKEIQHRTANMVLSPSLLAQTPRPPALNRTAPAQNQPHCNADTHQPSNANSHRRTPPHHRQSKTALHTGN